MPQSLNLAKIKKICRVYQVRPQRQKGQNFLLNLGVVEKIINAGDLKKSDKVLEVGPGLGILTEALVKSAGQVFSVELDKKLFGFLKVKFAGTNNLKLINGDILKFNPEFYKLTANSYKLIANIPYNITSIFLRQFLTKETKPSMMVFLVQKEVAQRICADVGKLSLLSVSVQFYGQPKIIGIIKKSNFWPQPEVDSAILKVDKIKNSIQVKKQLAGVSEKQFWQVVKVGFSARRKQLHNNLSGGLQITPNQAKSALISAGLPPEIRAQNLSVGDWIALAKNLKFYLN